MAIHSSILARRIPWTEKPGWLQAMGSQRVRHERATNTHMLAYLANICETIAPHTTNSPIKHAHQSGLNAPSTTAQPNSKLITQWELLVTDLGTWSVPCHDIIHTDQKYNPLDKHALLYALKLVLWTPEASMTIQFISSPYFSPGPTLSHHFIPEGNYAGSPESSSSIPSCPWGNY